jgi:MscS family membrane protein
MSEYLKQFELFNKLAQWLPEGYALWVTQIFLVVFFTLLLALISRLTTTRLYHRVKKTDVVWDDVLIESLKKPLNLLIWILGLSLAFHILREQTEVAVFDFVDPLRTIGVVYAFAWFLVRLIGNFQQAHIQRKQLKGKEVDTTTVDAISKLLRASVIITSFLVALQSLGFSISGVLAFGGIGGIAVGFAAKDLLANFFGGLMIYLDRPFVVGDWVRSPDRDIEGTVEHIGWRLTCIRTFDKRPLYIPNATFASIAVENPSRMSHRRIYETIGVRYDDLDRVPEILAGIEAMLKNHPQVDTSQTLMVNFNQFGPSSLDFFIYTFTHETNWQKFHQIKQDVLIQIADIIVGHGAEIAFPTQTIHLAEPEHIAEQ